MNVENMTNANGKTVANQFIVTTSEGRMFQSFKTNICFIPNDGGKVRLSPNWRNTSTTNKYRNQFLKTTTKDIERNLRNGDMVIDESL